MKKILVLMIVLVVCVGCDQGTKIAARHVLKGQAPISWLGDSFRLHYTENTGAFLGFGNQLSPHLRLALFVGFVSLLLTGLLIYLLCSRTLSLMALAAGALILGGGMSNLIDRILNRGAVVDFMNVGVGSLRTGIFNMADLAVMAGVVLFVFYSRQLNVESKSSR